MNKLLTVAEVAKILRVNKGVVYQLHSKGRLKLIKLGSLKCTEKSLQEFLDTYVGSAVEVRGTKNNWVTVSY